MTKAKNHEEANATVRANQAVKPRAKAAAPQTEGKIKTKQLVAKREAQVAKSGKRSAKAIAAAEAKRAKKERKIASADDTSAAATKAGPRKIRSRLERRGKGYRRSAELIDRRKVYGLSEALELIKKTSHVRFDATVELHARLAVDPKQADQNVRDSVILPAGLGKPVKVAVFAEDDDLAAAREAGADFAGNDELLQQLDKQKIDFDVLISTPSMMVRLGKYARLLGPKGLMPNPKSGTVTADIARAVREAKSGRVEYRSDSAGIVHAPMGKVSFAPAQLQENAVALMTSIRSNKPASVKGSYVKSIYLSTSMGPSLRLEPSAIQPR